MIKLSSGCGTSQLQLYTIPIKAALMIDAAAKFLITKKSPKRQIPAPNWRNLLSFSILARSAIVARNVDKTTRQHTNGRFRIVSEIQIYIFFRAVFFYENDNFRQQISTSARLLHKLDSASLESSLQSHTQYPDKSLSSMISRRNRLK